MRRTSCRVAPSWSPTPGFIGSCASKLVAAPVTILSMVFSMCAPGPLGHETITAPAAEAALASSELPTAAKLAGTALAVGGKRVDCRRSGRASARAVAMQATGFAIYGVGRIEGS